MKSDIRQHRYGIINEYQDLFYAFIGSSFDLGFFYRTEEMHINYALVRADSSAIYIVSAGQQ